MTRPGPALTGWQRSCATAFLSIALLALLLRFLRGELWVVSILNASLVASASWCVVLFVNIRRSHGSRLMLIGTTLSGVAAALLATGGLLSLQGNARLAVNLVAFVLTFDAAALSFISLRKQREALALLRLQSSSGGRRERVQ